MMRGNQTEGLVLPRLVEKTDFPEVDRVLVGLLGIFDGFFPARIRAFYVYGSYAHGRVTASSDLDLYVVFKDRIAPEERERLRHLRKCCGRLANKNLDIKGADEYSLFRYGLPVLSCNTRFLHGEDLRHRIPSNPVGFRHWAMHVPYGPNGLLAYLRRDQPHLVYPLGAIAPGEPFLGYDARRLRNQDGSMDKSVKMLPSAVMQLGMGLIGAQTGICPNNKASFPGLYREHIGDEWSGYLERVYDCCVLRCAGRIPTNDDLKREFSDLCEEALDFENHFLLRYRGFLLAELTSPRRQEDLSFTPEELAGPLFLRPARILGLVPPERRAGQTAEAEGEPFLKLPNIGQLRAAAMLGRVIYDDGEVHDALAARDDHEDPLLRMLVARSRQQISEALA